MLLSTIISTVPIVTFLTSLLIADCLGIRFFIQPDQKKCLKHEMYTNQLAVGEYEITDLSVSIVDMTITDSKGHTALNRENIRGKGKFAVTSDDADYYDLCFRYTLKSGHDVPAQQMEIYVDYKVGAEAKQYSATDDHDKLAEIERDLNRVEDLTESIIIDFAKLKTRAQEMRDTNASTNTRLFYQTIVSVIVLLVLASWQILYLRTFFRAKKLID